MRTLELIGAIADHLMAERDDLSMGQGISPSLAMCLRSSDRSREAHSTIHTTPNNPVFNPRYAPTPSTNGAQCTSKRVGYSSGAPRSSAATTCSRSWHITKNAELAELEAQLRTIPTPKASNHMHSPMVSMTLHSFSYSSRSERADGSHAKRRRASPRLSSVHKARDDPPTASYLTIRRVRPKMKKTKGIGKATRKATGASDGVPSRFATEFHERKDAVDGTGNAIGEPQATSSQPQSMTPKTMNRTERSRRALQSHVDRMQRARNRTTRPR